MNENIDLTKILKDCPKGTKLYSIVYGDVEFEKIVESEDYPIRISIDGDSTDCFSADGKIYYDCGECALFPSKEQRDWSKFTASWLKKERFDPKTLSEFDKVLVKHSELSKWCCQFFSYIDNANLHYKYRCICSSYAFCIPYNDDTQHLVGTKEDAPEFYRYWEE